MAATLAGRTAPLEVLRRWAGLAGGGEPVYRPGNAATDVCRPGGAGANRAGQGSNHFGIRARRDLSAMALG